MNAKDRWIWIALAAAVVGVLYARNAGRQRPAPAAAIPDVSTPVATERMEPAPTAGVSTAGVSTAEPAAQTNLPRLVDLGATTCIPCKLMAPILEDLKKTCVEKLAVEFIDVWEKPDAGKQYGINVIPTQIFYGADGKELFRHEGFFSKEDILAKWKEFGVELPVAKDGIPR